jgi:hypothetical protein
MNPMKIFVRGLQMTQQNDAGKTLSSYAIDTGSMVLVDRSLLIDEVDI